VRAALFRHRPGTPGDQRQTTHPKRGSARRIPCLQSDDGLALTSIEAWLALLQERADAFGEARLVQQFALALGFVVQLFGQ